MKPNIEILAPAGSYEILKTAVNAGADAVYIGGTRFGARAFADNPEEDMLLSAIDYVHLHGKKLYLTVNTLLKEEELDAELYAYLLPYYRRGLDAVIVQDVGVLKFIRDHFPGLDIHASTQMTLTGVSGARFMKEQGVSRIVTARELSLPEIREIVSKTGIEVESFVHGALCYCYSGQCLLSSLIGGRSGNRGQCAQPCRMLYQSKNMKQPEYLLSLKDICTLEILPDLIEAGIYSFKIEGRMKKPEYVAAVTSLYRKYADLYFQEGRKNYRVTEEDKDMLLDIYNRGGFHTGYYHTRNGSSMVSLKRPNHAGLPCVKVLSVKEKSIQAKALKPLFKGDVLEISDRGDNYTLGADVKKGGTIFLKTRQKNAVRKDQILNRVRSEQLLKKMDETYASHKLQEKINGVLILSEGKPATLYVSFGNISVQAEGEEPKPAQNQPVSADRLEKQLKKTGNTPFQFEQLDIQVEGNLFFPVQSLNELRRQALLELEKKICAGFLRPAPKLPVQKEAVAHQRKKYTSFRVLAETTAQYQEVCREKSVDRIYLDANAVEKIWVSKDLERLTELGRRAGKKVFLAMPHIFRLETEQLYEAHYEQLFDGVFDGVLIRNYESAGFLKAHHYKGEVVLDHSLYQFNRESAEFFRENGFGKGTAPLELNSRELKRLCTEDMELIAYGYLPVMVSAQCIQKTTGGCTHVPGVTTLKDRFQNPFSVKSNCDYCYNVIYNTDTLVLTGQAEEIENLGFEGLRLQFTTETAEEAGEVLKLYRTRFLEGKECEPGFSYTRGHFKRGIK